MNLKLSFLAVLLMGVFFANSVNVPQYRVFEHQLVNNSEYSNKFKDVDLKVQYRSPSGLLYNFYGFYDGDGKGGSEGNTWKIRFMPNEVGTWKYTYFWSDGTKGGNGTFECIAEGAGKGILKPYAKNPHWFAYNETDPVWLKSYYETGHSSIAQDFDWIKSNVYTPLIEAGYNHLQVNWLLSLCCAEQYYKDGPEPETLDLTLYDEGDLFGTMNLDVWKRMEKHLAWLNEKDVAVHMFLGVDGSKNDGPDWSKLSIEEKDWFVKYMVARLAPYANIAGWNYVWEVPGNREEAELGFARLIGKYDIFKHLCSYEDEFPRDNEFYRNEYSFAIVENHEITAKDRNMDRVYWKEPWTHHMACKVAYVGKPVFMSEGNALWRRFWQKLTHTTQDELRKSAWACATAGASFTWCGHAGEEALFASGSEGLPFNDENPYSLSEKHIGILAEVMSNEIQFYTMKPHDELLSACPMLEVYALAEPGKQYLVFSPDGKAFTLEIEKGNYSTVKWIDAKNGDEKLAGEINISDETKRLVFNAPSTTSDWVLILKN
ncbi:DUF5060 domain-containing protein [uncultured Draconibacterium sp.]|uniref:DUF5060 domain-containing protein n=1 Tax=uncultured Draconibacterium sp. TaxID=1573823 RepID=UPI003216CAD2